MDEQDNDSFTDDKNYPEYKEVNEQEQTSEFLNEEIADNSEGDDINSDADSTNSFKASSDANFKESFLQQFGSSGKSGTRSFWPLSVILNDLPPEIRFKHILFVGIMMVTNEPQPPLMSLFIDKFKEEATFLHTTGLTLELSKNYKTTLTFSPLCVIADSAAKPILQNRLKYNGYSSCSYCYQLGFQAV